MIFTLTKVFFNILWCILYMYYAVSLWNKKTTQFKSVRKRTIHVDGSIQLEKSLKTIWMLANAQIKIGFEGKFFPTLATVTSFDCLIFHFDYLVNGIQRNHYHCSQTVYGVNFIESLILWNSSHIDKFSQKFLFNLAKERETKKTI